MPIEFRDDLLLEGYEPAIGKKDNSVVEVFDLESDATPSTEEKDYDLKRNGKKLLKTDVDYVYQLKDGSGYVYRLYHKESNTDTWVMTDPETK